jgi:hypothetical protein
MTKNKAPKPSPPNRSRLDGYNLNKRKLAALAAIAAISSSGGVLITKSIEAGARTNKLIGQLEQPRQKVEADYLDGKIDNREVKVVKVQETQPAYDEAGQVLKDPTNVEPLADIIVKQDGPEVQQGDVILLPANLIKQPPK